MRDRQTGRDVVSPRTPAVEEFLTRACAAAVAQLRRLTTKKMEEARVPKGLRNNSARALLTKFCSIALQ